MARKQITPIKTKANKSQKTVISERTEAGKHFKYLDIITALFVTVLLISNIVAVKIVTLGIFIVPGAAILFPLSYIFGDILTEVYGYGKDRKVIWIGFICNVLMAATFMIVGALPAAPNWHNQDAYNAILGLTPRIVLASILGYWVGEFANSFVLAKMKVFTKGKYLWSRTIGSTLVGQFFDTLIFIFVAFTGMLPNAVLLTILISQYIVKVGIEVVFTPVTYWIVNLLKRAEHEDYYDKKTNFNPFTFQRS